MSRILQLELPDVLFTALNQRAVAEGTKPEVVAVETLQERFGCAPSHSQRQAADTDRRAAQERFERHFGTWDLPGAVGLNNEQIDADLAREYGRGLDDV
jgi:hypothetical protein